MRAFSLAARRSGDVFRHGSFPEPSRDGTKRNGAFSKKHGSFSKDYRKGTENR
jgi:hypothetical protein